MVMDMGNKVINQPTAQKNCVPVTTVNTKYTNIPLLIQILKIPHIVTAYGHVGLKPLIPVSLQLKSGNIALLGRMTK